MSTKKQSAHEESSRRDLRPETPAPVVSDAHRAEAHRLAETYRDDRPTTVLPGSGGMISGTAVADWSYGEDEPDPEGENANGAAPFGATPSVSDSANHQ